jgi:hypothetical protein
VETFCANRLPPKRPGFGSASRASARGVTSDRVNGWRNDATASPIIERKNSLDFRPDRVRSNESLKAELKSSCISASWDLAPGRRLQLQELRRRKPAVRRTSGSGAARGRGPQRIDWIVERRTDVESLRRGCGSGRFRHLVPRLLTWRAPKLRARSGDSSHRRQQRCGRPARHLEGLLSDHGALPARRNLPIETQGGRRPNAHLALAFHCSGALPPSRRIDRCKPTNEPVSRTFRRISGNAFGRKDV